MQITDIRETAIPLNSNLRNAVFDFSQMTTSIVAVITDVVRDGKPVVGYAFNSTGRYACGAQMRSRFIPRIMDSDPDSLIDDVQSAIRDMSGDAQDRAEGLLDRVRDRSKISKLQTAFDSRVADTMDRLNVPSKNDIDKINKKLNKILRVLEAERKPAPAKKKTATRRKAAAKPAPAKKTAEKAETKAA